jgi:hypothetical protein
MRAVLPEGELMTATVLRLATLYGGAGAGAL